MDQLHREEPDALLTPTGGVHSEEQTRRQRTGPGIRPRRLLLFGVTLAILGSCAPAHESTPPAEVVASADSAGVAAEITAMLQASADAWNRDDLAGFLDDYTDDPTLAFVGATEVRRGKAQVEAGYRESYFNGQGEAPDLAFDQLEVRPLGTGFGLAHGRWTLYEPGFDAQPVIGQGRFSLVLRKEGDEWKIMHDHSS